VEPPPTEDANFLRRSTRQMMKSTPSWFQVSLASILLVVLFDPFTRTHSNRTNAAEKTPRAQGENRNRLAEAITTPIQEITLENAPFPALERLARGNSSVIGLVEMSCDGREFDQATVRIELIDSASLSGASSRRRLARATQADSRIEFRSLSPSKYRLSP
jgi:hypothetical protein